MKKLFKKSGVVCMLFFFLVLIVAASCNLDYTDLMREQDQTNEDPVPGDVTRDYSGHVILYQHKDFKGESYQINKNVNIVNDSDLPVYLINQISSIKVVKGTDNSNIMVEVFTGNSYLGNNMLVAANIADLGHYKNGVEDDISSVKWVNCEHLNYTILFRDSNYSNKSDSLTIEIGSDISKLDYFGFNDIASSVQIVRTNGSYYKLFKHSYYENPYRSIFSDIGNLNDISFNDCASSLQWVMPNKYKLDFQSRAYEGGQVVPHPTWVADGQRLSIYTPAYYRIKINNDWVKATYFYDFKRWEVASGNAFIDEPARCSTKAWLTSPGNAKIVAVYSFR